MFLNSIGLNFNQLHADGIDGVVIRAELDYKFPLLPGDVFFVWLKVKKQGKLRILFDQQIIRKSDGKLMVNARITTVLTKNKRPVSPVVFEEKFQAKGIQMEEI